MTKNSEKSGLAGELPREIDVHGDGRTICVLVCLSHLELGGAALNAIDFAHVARKFGIKTILIASKHDLPPAGPSVLDFAKERGLSVGLFSPDTTTWKTGEVLTHIAVENNVDVIHTYGPLSGRAAYWGPSRFGRRPLVTTIYEADVLAQEFKGTSLIVGSEYLVDDLRSRPGSVTLVSPPVDLERDSAERVRHEDFLAEHQLKKENLRLVIVSRLVLHDHLVSKSPGIEGAMRCLDTLDRDDVDLVVVGSGSDAARLRGIGDQINARLNRRAIVFTGPMADPRPAYACADIVVGMGNSAARGLAFGKPLIAVGDFGKYELFEPGTAADLFRRNFWNMDKVRDPGADLGHHLRPLLDDQAIRAELGRFGRTFAVSNFGLEAMTKKLAGVYRDSLAEYGLRAWMLDLPRELAALKAKVVREATGRR